MISFALICFRCISRTILSSVAIISVSRSNARSDCCRSFSCNRETCVLARPTCRRATAACNAFVSVCSESTAEAARVKAWLAASHSWYARFKSSISCGLESRCSPVSRNRSLSREPSRMSMPLHAIFWNETGTPVCWAMSSLRSDTVASLGHKRLNFSFPKCTTIGCVSDPLSIVGSAEAGARGGVNTGNSCTISGRADTGSGWCSDRGLLAVLWDLCCTLAVTKITCVIRGIRFVYNVEKIYQRSSVCAQTALNSCVNKCAATVGGRTNNFVSGCRTPSQAWRCAPGWANSYHSDR